MFTLRSREEIFAIIEVVPVFKERINLFRDWSGTDSGSSFRGDNLEISFLKVHIFFLEVEEFADSAYETSVAFAIFFGICSKQRNEKKDTQEDAEQRATTDTMVMVKLENIADDLKDIKRESRENREEMKTLRERVVIVEQSLKSYHKRLDGEQHSDR